MSDHNGTKANISPPLLVYISFPILESQIHTYPKNNPNQMELTLDQLKQYDGTNPSNPIYIGVKGRIFDVTTGKSFYGPGGSYAMFAGKDASRALAKMSKNDEDVIGSLDGLTEKELGILDDWEKKFEAKYPIVGSLAA